MYLNRKFKIVSNFGSDIGFRYLILVFFIINNVNEKLFSFMNKILSNFKPLTVDADFNPFADTRWHGILCDA